MARDDPWAALGDPVDDAVEFGNPDQPVVTPPPAAAPVPGQAAAAPDAFAAVAERVNPAQLTDSTQQIEGFADQLPDQSAADREMPEDIRSETVRILSEHPLGTAADDARRYLASKGWEAGTDNFEKVIDFRAKHNVVDKNFQVLKPKPLEEETIPGAVARGVADTATMGFADELSGLADATKKAVTGNQSELGFWHDVHMADDVYSGRVDRDEAEHPLARISGQLIGGLAIPLSYEGVGLRAGTLAMKEAKAAGNITTREALKIGRKAAARAVTKQMARDGAIVGGFHGLGTGEGVEGRITEGLTEAGLGAAGGAAFGAAGEVIAPRIAAKAAAARALPLTDAQEVGQAAERQKIGLLPADVGGPAIRRATSVLTQTIAGGSPIIARAKRVLEQGKAVRDRVAAMVGTAANPEAAGETALEGALAGSRANKSRIGRIYDIAATQAGNARVELPKAKAVLDEQIARLKEVPGGGTGLKEAQDLRASLDGDFTVQGVRDMRTEMFVSPDFRGTPVERRLKQVVDAAALDIEDGLKAAGKPDAAKTFRAADDQWREHLTTMKRVIEPIIGKSEDRAKSGEEIVQALERAMKGNGRRFEKFIGALPDDEAKIVRASLIERMGRASAARQGAEGGDFSLNEFLTHWNNMGERAKAVTFGPEGRAALNDLAKVAEGTKEAQGYSNFSNTFGGVGNFLTAATGLASVPAFIKIVGAQYGLGRMLASPRFARWLAKVPKTSAGQMGYTKQLAKIAKAEPAIASDILSLQQRLTEAFANPAMQAAAEDDTTDTSQSQ